MIAAVIRWSARNVFLVLLGTLAVIAAGVLAVEKIPLDALPDLSDVQVILMTDYPGQAPQVVEDQVTYPLTTAMLSVPRSKLVRGFSFFGTSFVYIIFEDGTDIYWARSRTLEYLSKILPRLPQGVNTELGPDATAVGWVYEYSLVDKSGQNDLAQLRSFQDWNLRYQLQSVHGVAEVASIGGFQKQYQVNIDPNKLLAFNIPISTVVQAIRDGNNDVGGRLVEFSGAEYMVRGRGYAKSVQDIEKIVVGTDKQGTPVLVNNLGSVTLGPEIRRGVADLDGEGDTVGGIVIMRAGENALNVIERVKAKLEEIKPSLPKGAKIVTTYDRSVLIKRSIDTLKEELLMEIAIVSLVILIFLWHIPSAIIPILTIPVSVVLVFIPLYFMGLTSNIMSLTGIAISIGVLVDGAIVEVENAYKRLDEWIVGGRKGDFHEVRLRALKEVGPSVFFSLLVVAVAFLPVFTLIDHVLMGLDAETGVFMLLFLDLSYDDAVRKGKMNSYEDLRAAIIHGAVKRVRPKAMTVMAAMMGLLPIMWSMGTGADMMKRIAAPMIAGLVTSFIMELLVYPVIYALWKWWGEVRPRIQAVQQSPAESS